jgi:hypothetical protein
MSLAWAASRPRAAWSPSRDELPEVLAFEELGDDVRGALVRAHVEDRQDVRVVEGGNGAGLALEEGETLRVSGHLHREHLDRHVAPETRIQGAVHLPHAAGPEKLDDLVGSQARARRKGHGWLLQVPREIIRNLMERAISLSAQQSLDAT